MLNTESIDEWEDSGCDFFAYRLPGEGDRATGSCGRTEPGIHSGFVAAPFDSDYIVTIIPTETPEKNPKGRLKEKSQCLNPNDEAAHVLAVQRAIQAIDGRRDHKVVISRALLHPRNFKLSQLFADLCKVYPNAFVFCYKAKRLGCWIGASPELLLSLKGNDLKTMALAGTRPAGEEKPWDVKNIEEQQMVQRWIAEVFRRNGLKPTLSESYTRQAGPIEHICTDITAKMRKSVAINKLLNDLSPTPALAGAPRDWALSAIKRIEGTVPGRGCYGGLCGPRNSDGDMTLFVNLRSMQVFQKECELHVGGGITALSDPSTEWLETQRKAQTLLSLLP